MADPQTTGTLALRYPTDFQLSSLQLVTSIGTLDISPSMLELSIYEDLFGDTISGEVLITDSLGIVSNYTLNGTEFLQVTLKKTASDSSFLSRNFRVYKMGKRFTGDTNMYEVFSLMFCSEEFFISEQYRISKSFPNTPISDIIKTILGTYLKVQKPVSIETTIGDYDFVLPNKRIFETINWLTTYAQNLNGVGDFVFFENTKGYYFQSLSTLFGTNVYKNFYYDPKNLSNMSNGLDNPNMNQLLSNALDFEVLNFFDTLAGTKNGTFSNKLITFDVLQRKKNTTDGVYNYQKQFGDKKLNSHAIINDYQNRLGGTMYSSPPDNYAGLEESTLRLAAGNKEQKINPTVVSMNAVASIANDIRIEQFLPNRVAKLSAINYQRIKISVPGDPNLTIGRVVYFENYKMAPSVHGSPTREIDPFYSGNYLITSVRHIIKNNSYITVMELSKDSNIGPINGFNNSGSLQNLVNGVQVNG
jgi:hypothetical protein